MYFCVHRARQSVYKTVKLPIFCSVVLLAIYRFTKVWQWNKFTVVAFFFFFYFFAYVRKTTGLHLWMCVSQASQLNIILLYIWLGVELNKAQISSPTMPKPEIYKLSRLWQQCLNGGREKREEKETERYGQSNGANPISSDLQGDKSGLQSMTTVSTTSIL